MREKCECGKECECGVRGKIAGRVFENSFCARGECVFAKIFAKIIFLPVGMFEESEGGEGGGRLYSGGCIRECVFGSVFFCRAWRGRDFSCG
jgi:hypothetical protein